MASTFCSVWLLHYVIFSRGLSAKTNIRWEIIGPLIDNQLVKHLQVTDLKLEDLSFLLL